MLSKFWSKNGISFVIAAFIVLVVSALAIAIPNDFGEVISKSKKWISINLSTMFLIIPLLFLIVIGIFIFTKWGKRKIGEGRPQYKTFTWLAMLFTAGVGVGTLTFGVAEPIYHAADPHLSAGALAIGSVKAGTHTTIINGVKAAADFRTSIALSIWDWGLPAMAIYTISGLVVAWFAFNKRYKSSFQPGSVIENGFGGKTWAKYIGQGANVLAAITAVFTVAASLAIAGGNMTSSLSIAFFDGSQFGKVLAKWLAIGFIGLISVVYIMGSITPLKKGMAILGDYTMYIGLAILGFVFLVGPTQFFIKQIVQGIGSMPGSLANHFNTYPYDKVGAAWMQSWPISYILWWISWTPFMGVFLARISQGRTFRQYAAASVVVPAIFMAIWFSVFGGFAFKSLQNGSADIFDKVATTGSVNGAFFELMSKFPIFELVGAITLVVFVTFVATTGISASVSVASIVSRKGDEKPSKISILVWGIGITCIAIGLKLASGSSGKSMITIRDTAVVLGAPYMLVLILQVLAMFKSMFEEKKLIKEGKVEMFAEEKELPKYKMTINTYFNNRRWAKLSIILMGILLLIITVLCLRGIFSGHKQWGPGMNSMNHISTIEYIFGVIGIVMITMTIVLNSLVSKTHSHKRLKVIAILLGMTLNIFGLIMALRLIKDSDSMEKYNQEIEVKNMAPIEYEKWLEENKDNNDLLTIEN